MAGLDIDPDKLFEKIGYSPHSINQKNAHESKARFRVACCGRRWGKSTWAAREMLKRMFVPNTYHWIIGPTYMLGEKEFRIIYHDMFSKLKMGTLKGMKRSYNVKQGDMRIETPWNTVLEVKSADRPDSLVGEGLDSAIMSEAALHNRLTWEMYIEPALSDKRGCADFPSTPRGYNWYEGLWRLGQDTDLPMYESWRFPTWTNPVSFPGGREDPEILRIERQVSKAHFLQEYAAEFTAFEGQIYEEWDPTIHIQDIKYEPMWKNYITFDFGFKDPFCAYDIMVDPSDNVYVWREYQVSGMSTWEHAQIIRGRRNPPGYRVDGMFGDPRGADEIATLQIVLGSVYAPDVPWIQGIEAIKRWMKLQPDGKPKLYVDRSCYHMTRQLEQLRHKEVKEGQNVRREGQHDYDDHGPDALRYFFGPYFVLGANSHLSDVYGTGRLGSEGDMFFRLHKGFTTDTHIKF